ncbi:hypothetical protein ACFPK5_38770 [Streptomyces beijiangensis]|uniref:hypothetical protein n=1 Tax=Streptomyces beijiangensis TaxID=163361 RepID=UPI0033776787
MSKNWVGVPTAMPIVLRRCHRCASGRFNTVLERMNVRSAQPDRPAWQSPYGPSPHRAHRGRWAPVPGVAWSRSALRHGYLCGRTD